MIKSISAVTNYNSGSCLLQACSTGSGDVTDVADVSVCANTPANIEQDFFGTELPCIFPFYINGELYDTCRLLNRDDFIFPVNICPIRNITTKINGINSFTVDKIDDLLKSYLYCTNNAEQQQDDLLPPLDPYESCEFLQKRSAFSRCENNCIRGILLWPKQ